MINKLDFSYKRVIKENMQGKFYELPEKYKYSAAFESKIIQLTEEKANKYLSLASQDNLKKYLPKNINFEEKIDCLAIAGEAFLINKINLNDDGIDFVTASRLVDLFPISLIDNEHNRSNTVGVVLTATFTDIETNEELTKEDAAQYNKPFACVIGGIIWKLVNKELTIALEEVNNPESKWYNKIYYSWECAFDQYKLIELPKDEFDFNKGKIIDSVAQVKELDNKLKANGGTGIFGEKKICRVITGEAIPVGLGLVMHPAGQVTPLVVDNKEQIKAVKIKEKCSKSMVCPQCGEPMEMEDEDEMDDETEVECGKCKVSNSGKKWKKGIDTEKKEEVKAASIIEKSQENFTNPKNSVIEIKSNKIIMDKITDIKQITDETLKECKASAVVDFISEELKKADIKWKDSEKAKETAEADKKQIEANLLKIQEDLKKLQDAATAKANEELFNQRMTYFDDTYELSSEERQAIAAEVKDADNDNFEKAKAKFDIFLKDKSKATIQAKLELEEAEAKKNGKVFDKESKKWVNKEDMKEDKKEDKKESKASLEDKKVIDDALKNGEQVNAALPNAQAGEQTLEEKYAEAFKPENCIEISKR